MFFISILGIFIATEAKAFPPVRILLVPGHDREVWGAQYGNVKEADMNLDLAQKIYNILKKDERFEVFITRESGEYTKEFTDYFAYGEKDIISFRESSKEKRKKEIKSGEFSEIKNFPHNSVDKRVSIILYGINKWANDNKMDAVIHIHFNDYPRRSIWTIGKYKGFVIFIPEEQMSNSTESIKMAKSIFSELRKKYAVSTHEKEKIGLMPSQNLISLGSNGTLINSVRSILIEYGYIYRFKTKKSREDAYANMSALTVAGIENYFFRK